MRRIISQLPSKSPPASPSRHHSTLPGQWRTGDPIRFAPASPRTQQHQDMKTKNADVGTSPRGFRFGDPIRFAKATKEEEEQTMNEDRSSARKGKAVANTVESERSTSPFKASTNSPIHVQQSSLSYRATLASSAEDELSFMDSSAASWSETHRWDPPSPSPSVISRSSSTVRFDPNRSYAFVPSPSSSSSSRSFQDGRRNPNDEEMEVEVGTPGAVDRFGWSRKVEIGVQCGSPQVRKLKEKEVKPMMATMSQAELDQLVDGIDFRDEDFEMSDEDDSFGLELKPSLSTVTDRGRPRHQFPLTSSPPGTLPSHLQSQSQSHRLSPPCSESPSFLNDLFSPSSTNISNCIPSTSKASFPVPKQPSPLLSNPSSSRRRNMPLAPSSSTNLHLSSSPFRPDPPLLARTISSAAAPSKDQLEVAENEEDEVDSSIEILPPTLRSEPTERSQGSVPTPTENVPAQAESLLEEDVEKKALEMMALPTTDESTADPVSETVKVSRTQRKQDQDTLLKSSHPEFRFEKWNGRPRVVYTKDEKTVELVLQGMDGPFGFDLEWKPNWYKLKPENKTALVQICDQQTILLVHVAQMPFFPPALKAFIEDATKIKLGVNISGDGNKLRRDFGHHPAGLLELSAAARLVDSERWKSTTYHLIALQTLTAAVLDRYLPKESSTRCGLWDQQLNDSQKRYAANDVYASLQIFLTLLARAPPGVDLYSLVKQVQIPPAPQNDSAANPPAPTAPFLPHLPSASTSSKSSSKLKSTTRAKPTSSNPSAPKPLKTRQLEAFALWSSGESILSIKNRMSASRPVTARTVVWYLLEVIDSALVEFDSRKFLETLDSVPSEVVGVGASEKFLGLFSEVREKLEQQATAEK